MKRAKIELINRKLEKIRLELLKLNSLYNFDYTFMASLTEDSQKNGIKPILQNDFLISSEAMNKHQITLNMMFDREEEIFRFNDFKNLKKGFVVICVDNDFDGEKIHLKKGFEYVVEKVLVGINCLTFCLLDFDTGERIDPPSGFLGFNSKRFSPLDYGKLN
jgi:hypothetical protein